MDIEFVNLFIARQKSTIDDLHNKLIMSETRNQLLESSVGALRAELDKITKELESLKGEVKRKKSE